MMMVVVVMVSLLSTGLVELLRHHHRRLIWRLDFDNAPIITNDYHHCQYHGQVKTKFTKSNILLNSRIFPSKGEGRIFFCQTICGIWRKIRHLTTAIISPTRAKNGLFALRKVKNGSKGAHNIISVSGPEHFFWQFWGYPLLLFAIFFVVSGFWSNPPFTEKNHQTVSQPFLN